MKIISHKQLVELLLNPAVSGINGASFIGLDSLTDVGLKGGKSNPMLGQVQKCTIGSSVMVFQNKNSNGYANMVKRRLEQEGKNPATFELSPRKWGQRIDGTPLVEHKGTYYLEVIFLKSGQTSYLLNGRPIKKALIQGLESDHEESVQGGLDDKVVIRSYKVDSLTRISINNDVYILQD